MKLETINIGEGDDLPPRVVCKFGSASSGKEVYGIYDYVDNECEREGKYVKLAAIFLAHARRALKNRKEVTIYRIDKMPGSAGTVDIMDQRGTVALKGKW